MIFPIALSNSTLALLDGFPTLHCFVLNLSRHWLPSHFILHLRNERKSTNVIAILDITCSNLTKVFEIPSVYLIGRIVQKRLFDIKFSPKSVTGLCRFEMLRKFWRSVVLRSSGSRSRMISQHWIIQFGCHSKRFLIYVWGPDSGPQMWCPSISGTYPLWQMLRKYLDAELSANHQLVLVNYGTSMTRLDENQDQKFTD